MAKKTGKGTQLLIRLEKDPRLLHEFEFLKNWMHTNNNIEVVRRLVDKKYEELQEAGKIP